MATPNVLLSQAVPQPRDTKLPPPAAALFYTGFPSIKHHLPVFDRYKFTKIN